MKLKNMLDGNNSTLHIREKRSMNLKTQQYYPTETEKTGKNVNRTSVSIKQPDIHVIGFPKEKGEKNKVCVCVRARVYNGQNFFKFDKNYKIKQIQEVQ